MEKMEQPNGVTPKQVEYIVALFPRAYPQPASERIKAQMPDVETLGEYLARVWDPRECNRRKASNLIEALRREAGIR